MPVTSPTDHLATDPIRNFRFIANIKPNTPLGPGLLQLGFSSVGGFAANTEVIPYREGGMNTTVRKLPGQTDFNPLTFTKGVLAGSTHYEVWQWYEQIFSVIAGGGTPTGAGFRIQLSVDILAHPSTSNNPPPKVLTMVVYNAWVSAVQYSDLDATANGLTMEAMTVQHEGFKPIWA